ANQSSGQLTATAGVTWSDAALNNYGPLSSSFSTANSVPNQAPVVNAGPNQTIELPTSTVTLNGTATDDGKPTGSTLTISWTKVSGPGPVTFSSPSTAVTQATFTTAGTYVLQLSANDTQLTSTSNVTVTVLPVNQAPAVSAGANQTITLPTSTVTLNGTVTDDGQPPNSSLAIQWTQQSGPAGVTFTSPNTAVTQATFPGAGVYVLKLSANDTQLTGSATVTITVQSSGVPPVASFTTTGIQRVVPATIFAVSSTDGIHGAENVLDADPLSLWATAGGQPTN